MSMTGEQIKEILKEERISLREVAAKLGYDSDQRLHNALRGDNVKSKLIEEIAAAINKNVCFFYEGQSGATAVGDAANAQHGDGNTYHNGADAATIDRLIGEMSEQRRSYEKQIDRLLTLLEHRLHSGNAETANTNN